MAVPKTSAKAAFLDILLQHQREQPDAPINLAAVARQVGVTRQLAHVWYQRLGAEYHLPANTRAYYLALPDRLRPQVRDLIEQGLTNQQIAQRLDAPPATVAQIGREVRQTEGVVPNRPMVELRETVRRLRLEGLGNVTIAARLGLSQRQVMRLVVPLLTSGAIPRLKHRRSPQERAALDAQVQDLYERGLTYPAIAQALQVERPTVISVMSRLRRRGAITPRQQRLSRADYQTVLARVEALLAEDMSPAQIAQALGLNADQAKRAVNKVRTKWAHGASRATRAVHTCR